MDSPESTSPEETPISEQDLLRDRFFSYIFHELRTPLTVIHSYAQIIQTKLPNTPEFNGQRRISELMVTQGDEMVEMIEELLEAGRIPLRRLNLDLVEYDFVELMESLIEHLPESKQNRIELSLLAKPVTIMAEGPRLERALLAVLNFALMVDDHHPLKVELVQDTDSQCLTMIFPTPLWQPTQPELDELFDLYRPVRYDQNQDTHSALKAGKLDISLYVARGLIEGHNGTLDYKQDPPSFVVVLPLVS